MTPAMDETGPNIRYLPAQARQNSERIIFTTSLRSVLSVPEAFLRKTATSKHFFEEKSFLQCAIFHPKSMKMRKL
jgi:hypothetical protein